MDPTLSPVLARALVVAGLAACLLSYSWGMYRFFTVPAPGTPGVATIRRVGISLGLASLLTLTVAEAPSPLRCALALLVCAASLGLFWWAVRTNRRRPLSFAFVDDLPVHLVREGPYRCIRHPFYSAYLLGWLITPIATGEPLALLPFAVMAAIYALAAHVEERKFEASALREAYARYRCEAGMFWPRARCFGRCRSSQESDIAS